MLAAKRLESQIGAEGRQLHHILHDGLEESGVSKETRRAVRISCSE